MNTISFDTAMLDMFSDFDDILSVDDVAKMLKTDKKRTYRMIRSGEIKSIRFGRSIRIPKLWVIEYIQEYGSKQEISIHEQRQKLVAEFCREPKSRKQIQEFLDLSDKLYFRQTVLIPLLDAGVIKQTIPEYPAHLKQRYITVL